MPATVAQAVLVTARLGVRRAEALARASVGLASTLGEVEGEDGCEAVRGGDGLVLGDHVGEASAEELALGVMERELVGEWLLPALAEWLSTPVIEAVVLSDTETVRALLGEGALLLLCDAEPPLGE